MDLQRCLQRIDYRGPDKPDPVTLTAMQRQFLLHVPFENLDIHLDEPITLSLSRCYEKIVERRRGGFCYECNHLFHAMLAAMGFSTSFHGAKMMLESSQPLENGHMVMTVELDEVYLVDVGNGQSCHEPLRLDGGNRVISEGIEYRIVNDGDHYILNYCDGSGEWKPRFRFTTESIKPEQFAEPCRIQQISPESRFTRHCLASIATGEGRVTLLDGELTTQQGDDIRTTSLQDADAYSEALSSRFGIRLQHEAVQRLYSCIEQRRDSPYN